MTCNDLHGMDYSGTSACEMLTIMMSRRTAISNAGRTGGCPKLHNHRLLSKKHALSTASTSVRYASRLPHQNPVKQPCTLAYLLFQLLRLFFHVAIIDPGRGLLTSSNNRRSPHGVLNSKNMTVATFLRARDKGNERRAISWYTKLVNRKPSRANCTTDFPATCCIQ